METPTHLSVPVHSDAISKVSFPQTPKCNGPSAECGGEVLWNNLYKLWVMWQNIKTNFLKNQDDLQDEACLKLKLIYICIILAFKLHLLPF